MIILKPLRRRFVNKRRENSMSGKVFVEIAFVCWVLADYAPSFEVAQHAHVGGGDDSLLIRSSFKGGYTWKKSIQRHQDVEMSRSSVG